jgi:gliding motility-associated protein GldL
MALTVGLWTEAVIFFFSAFEPPHEEVDWSLVYPELGGMHDEDHGAKGHGSSNSKSDNTTLTQQMDKMLADAKIGPELIESLGEGMRSLSDNANRLSNLSDASVVTNDYTNTLKVAATSVSEFAESSSRAAMVMGSISNSTDEIGDYTNQIQSATKNLASLNAVYELQLQDTSSQLKAASKLYEGMNMMMSNLSSSVEQTHIYNEQITKLASNLTALNTVYGNMLSAMNYNPNR